MADRQCKTAAAGAKVKTGYLSRYARLVTSASTGAVLK